ncbi:MAG TPA: cell division protein FtsZ [Bacteroidota bacterium]|nr:cell division protein FtsZ [Bacteroidota bacterium]
MIEFVGSSETGAKIRIVGVGGGGGNAVNSMIEKGLVGVDFVAVNTDMQALERNKSEHKIRIGKNLTRGLGAGADPQVGQRAAEEDKEEIARVLGNCDMVFVTAGMGGGTGTGAGPVVANIAKSLGALVVGIVTKPFNHEGKRRLAAAELGIEELRKQVDTLIVIPNQRLLAVVDRATPISQAFEIANAVLHNAARGISDIITVPGYINVDFADVKRVMREMGDALMGTGIATGENRAVEAATMAISSPLLEGVSVAGAQKVLVNITANGQISIDEYDAAVQIITEAAGGEVEVISGLVFDDNMTDEVMVTVIATGFNKKTPAIASQERPFRVVNKVIDHVPTGPSELKPYDQPAIARNHPTSTLATVNLDPGSSGPINYEENDRPAFLRKIMD